MGLPAEAFLGNARGCRCRLWISADQASAEVTSPVSLSRLDFLPQHHPVWQGRAWFAFDKALQPDPNFPDYPAVLSHGDGRWARPLSVLLAHGRSSPRPSCRPAGNGNFVSTSMGIKRARLSPGGHTPIVSFLHVSARHDHALNRGRWLGHGNQDGCSSPSRPTGLHYGTGRYLCDGADHWQRTPGPASQGVTAVPMVLSRKASHNRNWDIQTRLAKLPRR